MAVTEGLSCPILERGGAREGIEHRDDQDEQGDAGSGDGRREGSSEAGQGPGRDQREERVEVRVHPEALEQVADRADLDGQAVPVLGHLDDELGDGQGDHSERGEHDHDDHDDCDREREGVPDTAPLEGAHQRPGHQGQEQPEQHRHHERGHLAQQQGCGEHEHQRADRRERAGWQDRLPRLERLLLRVLVDGFRHACSIHPRRLRPVAASDRPCYDPPPA